MDLQAVRLAVIFRDDADLPGRRGAKDAAVRDVDAVEVAVAVEGRTFEKGRHRHAGMLLARPRREVGGLVAAKMIGKPHEHLGLDHLRRVEMIHPKFPVLCPFLPYSVSISSGKRASRSAARIR
jgi:hypothetical protein